MKNNSVLIMAGGTGGHVFPGLALAEEMAQRGYKVSWLGTEAGIETNIVPAADIPLYFIPVRGVRGKSLKNIFAAPWNIFASVREAMNIIRRLDPAVVVGLGGFVAGPGGVAAKLMRIPLVIHEQNAVAGTTNKILSILAKRVLTAFPGVLKNSICIGNPVRKSIEVITDPMQRLVTDKSKVKVLIVGGSRGAKAINDIMPAALANIARKSEVEVWHQTGKADYERTSEAYLRAEISAQVNAFVDDMPAALAWADIAICRSGALTVSELAATGLGAILIPFPYAIDDHQTKNAEYLQQSGAAIIRQQASLTEEKMTLLLEDVLFDKEKLKDMAIKAKKMAKPGAAKAFADCCEEVLNG